jgi:hypothetical protein
MALLALCSGAPSAVVAGGPTTQPSSQQTTQPTSQPKPTSAPKAVERVSLPITDVAASWALPGFRVSLGLTFSSLFNISGGVDGPMFGPNLRAGFRLSRRWSLLATFRYSVLIDSLEGLHYALVIEPTLHLTEGLSVSLGAGYAGMIANRTQNFDEGPSRCEGGGAIGLTRAQYLFRLGHRGSTGPMLAGLAQWSDCEGESSSWWHLGISASWVFVWR